MVNVRRCGGRNVADILRERLLKVRAKRELREMISTFVRGSGQTTEKYSRRSPDIRALFENAALDFAGVRSNF